MTDVFKREPDYQVSEVKRMREMFEAGTLGRRHFLQGLLAAGLSATTAAAVVTGSRDVQASTPKRGGLIRMAGPSTAPTIRSTPCCGRRPSATPVGVCTTTALSNTTTT